VSVWDLTWATLLIVQLSPKPSEKVSLGKWMRPGLSPSLSVAADKSDKWDDEQGHSYKILGTAHIYLMTNRRNALKQVEQDKGASV
jgi:hypothetical protein